MHIFLFLCGSNAIKKMRVITLDNNSLEKYCGDLAIDILKSGFCPQLVLGVKTGGAIIADRIFSHLKSDKIAIDYCHPVRSSTVNKKNILKKYLKNLPKGVLDFFRKVEYKLIFSHKSRKNFIKIELPEKISEFNEILIVDDALDSGATLKSVVEKITSINPDVKIKTAVLTITHDHPSFFPDFYIFNNKTLLRFPWSIDSK